MMQASFGLIGKSLKHSFSKSYFEKKFSDLGLPYRYELFELDSIDALPVLLAQNPHLKGFNVTIPYKIQILPYLDFLSPQAQQIGAVNTVVRTEEGKIGGYNTDFVGFEQSLLELVPKPILQSLQALILGNGGAAATVKAVLEQHQIPFIIVGRSPNLLPYEYLDKKIIAQHQLIVNTTPLGMYPDIDTAPPIPYEHLTDKHYLLDLVYNPAQTLFIKHGAAQGASTQNGLTMLHTQAEAAWAIWANNVK
jgi:shikimate dehydrogenase